MLISKFQNSPNRKVVFKILYLKVVLVAVVIAIQLKYLFSVLLIATSINCLCYVSSFEFKKMHLEVFSFKLLCRMKNLSRSVVTSLVHFCSYLNLTFWYTSNLVVSSIKLYLSEELMITFLFFEKVMRLSFIIRVRRRHAWVANLFLLFRYKGF